MGLRTLNYEGGTPMNNRSDKQLKKTISISQKNTDDIVKATNTGRHVVVKQARMLDNIPQQAEKKARVHLVAAEDKLRDVNAHVIRSAEITAQAPGKQRRSTPNFQPQPREKTRSRRGRSLTQESIEGKRSAIQVLPVTLPVLRMELVSKHMGVLG